MLSYALIILHYMFYTQYAWIRLRKYHKHISNDHLYQFFQWTLTDSNYICHGVFFLTVRNRMRRLYKMYRILGFCPNFVPMLLVGCGVSGSGLPANLNPLPTPLTHLPPPPLLYDPPRPTPTTIQNDGYLFFFFISLCNRTCNEGWLPLLSIEIS